VSGGGQPARRVAVTGLGALSPGGGGVAAYRGWLAAGHGAAGGTIVGFEPGRYIRSAKLLRSMHRTFQLVAAAAVEAMRAAGLPTAESLVAAGIAPERAGIAAALADLSPLTPDLLQALAQAAPEGEAGTPGWARFAELALHQLHPFRRLTLLANMAAAHTSLLYGLQGPSFTFTTGAAAGTQTIAEAYWTIAHGRAELMLCQAAESPDQACTAEPVVEIAGAVVLESWESAAQRKAPILTELRAEAVAGARPQFSLAEPGAGSPAASLLAALLRLEELAAAGGGVALGELLGASGAAA